MTLSGPITTLYIIAKNFPEGSKQKIGQLLSQNYPPEEQAVWYLSGNNTSHALIESFHRAYVALSQSRARLECSQTAQSLSIISNKKTETIWTSMCCCQLTLNSFRQGALSDENNQQRSSVSMQRSVCKLGLHAGLLLFNQHNDGLNKSFARLNSIRFTDDINLHSDIKTCIEYTLFMN